MSFEHRVAVVGAGVAGLSAARLLCARPELDVVVFESTDRAGGVVRTTSVDGFMREHAVNAFMSGAAGGAVELADELGVAMHEAAPAARRRWIYVRGALKPLPTNPLEAVTTDLVSWRGKLIAALEPLRRSRRAPDESVYEFARRRLGDEVARTIVAPFVTGIFAGEAADLSVASGFPELAELEAEGGIVRGFIKSARERRRRSSADGRERPGPRMFAPIGGTQALVDALAADLGDRLHLGVPVASIERDRDVLVTRFPNGETDRFDVVVLAAPAFRAARAVAELAPDAARELGAIEYAPAVVVHLGFDRTDIGHPLDGYGFLVAEGEAPRILGGVFESALWPNRAPEGKALVRCILGGTRDPAAIDLSDDEAIRIARRDLRRILDAHGEPVHADVTRWPRAIAQYPVGHAERVARAEAACAKAGVVLAGSAYHGVGVNSCTADAPRVFARVMATLSAMAVVVLAVVALGAGCSGGGKSSTKNNGDGGGAGRATDAGPTTPPGAAPPYLVADLDADGGVVGAGSIEATVSWLQAPAAARGSAGRNACGQARPPRITVHTLGGVRGAIVTLSGVKRGRAPDPEGVAELAIRDCRVAPGAARAPRLGAALAVINDDERRADIVVEHLGDGTAAPTQLARFSLPLVGHRVDVPLAQPGIVRVSSAADLGDPAYVAVPGTPYVAITNDEGAAVLEQVPAGTYDLTVWFPPVTDGGEPLVRTAPVTVVAGEAAEVTISLGD